MRIHNYFSTLIVIGILPFAMSGYAFKQSAFRFSFHNDTESHTVTIQKLGSPSGAILREDIGPTDMKSGEMHKYFLVQNSQTEDDKSRDPLVIQMSWLLTLRDKGGKILCQNKIWGWVKGDTDVQGNSIDTSNWRYKISSIQSSIDKEMCPFKGKHPARLPKHYSKYGMKCYPFSVSIAKDNSINIVPTG